MGIEATAQALRRRRIPAGDIRAVWVGTESKPYAVKPTATIVAEALGLTPQVSAADLEFACKAGSEAMLVAIGYVGSGMAPYAIAIGMDTAQSEPGDSLEYTAAAGGAAFVIGRGEEAIAMIEASFSFVTDTPDFFRRAHRHYPQHGQRFTGAQAYFYHSLQAARTLLEGLGRTAQDYRWAVFHQPNPIFVLRLARELGFQREQIEPGFLVPYIGNTYAGSSLIGLAGVLDVAQPGDRILFTSYGSGAGSDAMSLGVTQRILTLGQRRPTVRDLINRKREVRDYGIYLKLQGKIRME
jgi:hydroxymethylglutaryl-CoA synthase